ncbi:MAG: hypothetical protein AABZ55_02310 [Bdellovibrionota bacterium]
MQLTAENYTKGFLIDEDLMGGVTEDPENPGRFVAFVLRHSSGEYLGAQPFSTVIEALDAINKVKRDWKFEKSSGCGGCKDGNCSSKEGGCNGGGCKNGSCPQE